MSELLARYSMREKLIVGLGLLILVILGAHALVIEPYQLRVTELEEEIIQQSDDLEWMRSAVTRLPPPGTGSASTVAISGSLANFVDQVVRGQGLSSQLSQMSPIGSNEIRMRYKDVDFNRLVGFIAQVNTRGLEVKDIRISALDNPGAVDSSIVLVRR